MLKARNSVSTKVGYILLIGIGLYLFLGTWLPSVITYPALVSNSWIIEPINHWMTHRKGHEELVQELALIKKEYQVLEEKYAQLEAQRAYLNGIKEIRTFNERFAQKGVIARILGRSFTPDGHFFFVGAGTRDAISIDTMVLSHNALVGRVIEVYPGYSKIRLITDSQCKIGAYCGPHRALGIHEGCNREKETQLRYVDHLSRVQEGDMVLSSGEGMVFLEGFALGTVTRVAPQGLYQEVAVKPACNLREIDYCLLIAKNDA